MMKFTTKQFTRTGSIQYNLCLSLLGAIKELSREKHHQQLAWGSLEKLDETILKKKCQFSSSA